MAVSHAIEDECSARGERAVLVGSFQRERFYREAEPRWREFARTAELALALADFEQPARRPRGPVEVPIERDHPLAGEWAIVCDGPGFAACLAGRERQVDRRAGLRDALVGGAGGGARRRAASGWTSRPPVRRSWPSACPSACRGRPPRTRTAVARATSVTNRMLAYVAAAGRWR